MTRLQALARTTQPLPEECICLLHGDGIAVMNLRHVSKLLLPDGIHDVSIPVVYVEAANVR